MSLTQIFKWLRSPDPYFYGLPTWKELKPSTKAARWADAPQVGLTFLTANLTDCLAGCHYSVHNLTVLQLGMLAYRFGLEDEAAFPDDLVIQLQPVQNRVKPM